MFLDDFFLSIQSEGKGPREEIQHIPRVVVYTSVFAFLFGGQFGKRIIDENFRRHNQLTVYDSVMHAKRQYQASVALGFVKYGSRWGWRAGLFSGVFRYRFKNRQSMTACSLLCLLLLIEYHI